MAINYLNSINLNQNELIKAQIENQPNNASAGTGVEGQLYYDTTLDVLKVWAGGSWVEVGGGVETLTTTDGTYIDLTPNSATAGAVTVTADLSAADGTASAASRFLTKDNTWATVPQGDITALTEGTYINIDNPGGPIPTINHDLTTRTDGSTAETLTYGGTFTAYTDVTTNATGHITDVEETTFTMPASDNTNTTYTLPTSAGGLNTAIVSLTAGGSGGGGGTVTFAGTDDQIAVTETVGENGTVKIGLADDVTFINDIHIVDAGKAFFGTDDDLSIFHDGTDGSIDNATGNLEIKTTPSNSDLRLTSGGSFTLKVDTSRNSIQAFKNGGVSLNYNGAQRFETTSAGATVHGIATITGAASIDGTLDMNSNKISNVLDPTDAQDAATKQYVDDSNVGQLVYQGGYNASTNVPNLDNTPTITINTGFTWTVTADGLFFTEQVRVGDLIIANVDSPTALADWTTVQNNVDLADSTTVGLGNVVAGEAIDVAYSNGTATVSVEDSSATNKGAVIVAPGDAIDVSYASGTATVSVEDSTSSNPGALTVAASSGTFYDGLIISSYANAVATIGLDIDGLANLNTTSSSSKVAVYDEATSKNKSMELENFFKLASSSISKTGTIAAGSLSGTVAHTFGQNTLVQTFDAGSGETVFCDVVRGTTSPYTVTATISATQATAITILVQKIG